MKFFKVKPRKYRIVSRSTHFIVEYKDGFFWKSLKDETVYNPWIDYVYVFETLTEAQAAINKDRARFK